METILQVKGMMCPHCEAHVKTALEAIPGVTEAKADHNTGTVTLRTDAPVSEAALKQAVEQAGYEFVSKN